MKMIFFTVVAAAASSASAEGFLAPKSLVLQDIEIAGSNPYLFDGEVIGGTSVAYAGKYNTNRTGPTDAFGSTTLFDYARTNGFATLDVDFETTQTVFDILIYDLDRGENITVNTDATVTFFDSSDNEIAADGNVITSSSEDIENSLADNFIRINLSGAEMDSVNLELRRDDGSGGSVGVNFAPTTLVPAPGALAVLGLGLAGTVRRR